MKAKKNNIPSVTVKGICSIVVGRVAIIDNGTGKILFVGHGNLEATESVWANCEVEVISTNNSDGLPEPAKTADIKLWLHHDVVTKTLCQKENNQ